MEVYTCDSESYVVYHNLAFLVLDLATVLIAVVCIALPIRVTLTDAKIRNEIEFIYFCVQFYPTK